MFSPKIFSWKFSSYEISPYEIFSQENYFLQEISPPVNFFSRKFCLQSIFSPGNFPSRKFSLQEIISPKIFFQRNFPLGNFSLEMYISSILSRWEKYFYVFFSPHSELRISELLRADPSHLIRTFLLCSSRVPKKNSALRELRAHSAGSWMGPKYLRLHNSNLFTFQRKRARLNRDNPKKLGRTPPADGRHPKPPN